MNAPVIVPVVVKARSKWVRRGLVLTLLISLAVLGLSNMGGGNAEVPIDDALITRIRRKDLAVEVIDTGKVQPREKVDIKSKVSGQVLKVLVDEGEVVTKGQVLLTIDPVDYSREAARVDAELAQAQQALAFAELTLARKTAALAERAVSQADVELSQNEVDMRKASIRIADVAVSAAKDRLRSCEVRSPLAGTIIERGIEPGEVVSPGVQATFEGKPLLTVADLSTLIARVELNQIDVARVALGQTAKLALDALPDRSWTGTVTKIAPAAVKAEGRDAEVFPVEVTLSGADASIKSGMTADVRILVETRAKVLLLPIEAVLKEHGKSFAKRVKVDAEGNKSSEKIEIKTGKSNDREIEVMEGLKEGDDVVIDPASAKENEADL
ncbi:MAG: efflux RND transporter periplasmic adaptor subunit [Deltaproteobacteria bacterium]|nr:efflux RND transporter periplasmic adaptor subunit [Deltaproteobacteria bacterium]